MKKESTDTYGAETYTLFLKTESDEETAEHGKATDEKD